MKGFNVMGVPWKIWFLKRGFTKNQYIGGNCVKRGGGTFGQFTDLRGGCQKRGGGVFFNAHYDDKKYLSIFPKMPSEIFCSRICWQNFAKTSFMHQQWTATVLKVPTTDSLVFFSGYISRTAILTQIFYCISVTCLSFIFIF